jgi:tRNA pseudouridine38-40 synthase
MACYQVILAYDGTQFSGSQRQAKSRTVQGELETALRVLGWSGRSVLLAGRTDAGVHASGQVAAFDLDWQHPGEDLLASPGFHPRFDARSRVYRYRLFCQAVRDPLREKFAWRVWPAVAGEALRSVARLFVGNHDFGAYGTPPRPASSTMRTVLRSSWEVREDEWHYEVQAEAFLYRMVRRLVYVQVAVAQGNLSTETVEGSLRTRDTGPQASILPSGVAPAQGLTLVEVTY